MARRTVVTLVDDLTNEPLPEDGGDTITFSLDGTTYEIDLSHDNARQMRDEFGKYLRSGRMVNLGHGRRPAPKNRQATDRKRVQAIRAWGEYKGLLKPNSRGRIPREVVDMYEDRSVVQRMEDERGMSGQTTIDADTPTAEQGEPKAKRSRKPKPAPPEFSAEPPKAPNQEDVHEGDQEQAPVEVDA